MHFDYDTVSDDNDIALLFLDQDLSDDARLSVVTLEALGDAEECCDAGDVLQAIGYGLDAPNGSRTDTLEFAEVNARGECMQNDINEDMRNQGVMGLNIDKGLTLLSSKFPAAQGLMLKIKKYRNRDSIVLACVCGVCVTFMFIYWLNK